MNFTCFCFRLNVATGRSKVTHGARVLCLLDNAVLPNRSRGCQVLSMSLHLYKISVPRRLRRGCHWPMKSFSAVCPPLQFLPHQKTHNTWARAPAHWAWLTEVWPLSPSDPTGTLFQYPAGQMCPREGKQLTDKERDWTSASPRLLSTEPSPGSQSEGVGSSPLWGRSEIVLKC